MIEALFILLKIAIAPPHADPAPRWVEYLRKGDIIYRYDPASAVWTGTTVSVPTGTRHDKRESSTVSSIDCAAHTVSYREMQTTTPDGTPEHIYLTPDAARPRSLKGTPFEPLANLLCRKPAAPHSKK